MSLGSSIAHLRAIPYSGVQAVDKGHGQWEASGSDPVFALSGIERWAGRWVRFRVCVSVAARDPDWALLAFDLGTGAGFSAAWHFGGSDRTRETSDLIVYLPAGLRSARMQLVCQRGRFAFNGVDVASESKWAAAAHMLSVIRHRDGWHAVGNLLWQSLFGSSALSRIRAREEIVERYRELKRGGDDYARWIDAFESSGGPNGGDTDRPPAPPTAPRISVVVPVFNPPEKVLRECVESVLAQSYSNWELCVADDASTESHVRTVLSEYAARDARIRVVYRNENGHISAASNSALALATGDFVALLDHDDRLHPSALQIVAGAIARHPDVALIFSDEDKLDEQGVRHSPYFKCEFNYELFLAHNMISHLGVYRRDVVAGLGGFREGFEGSQDYDLALRVVEAVHPSRIVHIPHVLYHWRVGAGSTAQASNAKPYAIDAARRAVKAHLERRGVRADVGPAPKAPAMNRVRFALVEPEATVSIIIPTRDRARLLEQCVRSIFARTSYPNFEVVIVDNGSRERATQRLLDQMRGPRLRVVRDESPFNFSGLNNQAVAQCASEFVCLMNNDVEVLSPNWLEEMLGFAQQSGIGAVGCRLWYPNGTLQHGGVILGVGRVANHAHKYLRRGNPGYFGRAVLHQSFSAVTAACLLVRRSLYLAVGGLDEALPVAFNDVDFCLRLRDAGFRNVWTPYAELIHHESASRGHESSPEKRERFRAEIELMERRWGEVLRHDPAYSPNLSLTTARFTLAWPPRVDTDGRPQLP